MASFNSIVKDIKEIKIQGASNIAKAAVNALETVSHEYKNTDEQELINVLNKAKIILFKIRPTEPCMRNALNYVLENIEEEKDIVRSVRKRAEYVMGHFEKVDNKVSEFAARKISNNMVVFTHCHSSSVIRSLIKAKKQGKRFEVHNTETRPFYQGRITARELSKNGIPIVHYVDSAARIALKKADIMFLGADAITTEGKVINKIGSELFAEVAERYDVPLYICSDSWKFNPLSVFGYEEIIEKRAPKEVWPTAPRGVFINNISFEKINSDLITGIISELGVYPPEVFVEEVKKTYPWTFNK